MKYNDNGTIKEVKVKAFDTLPPGAIIDYDGETVPDNYEIVDENWIYLGNDTYYKKQGNIVTVTGFSGGTTSLVANDYKIMGILPDDYRPRRMIVSNWSRIGEGQVGTARIETNGEVKLFSTSAPTFWGFTITYLI